MDSLKEDHGEFIKNTILILKARRRFRSEEHNVLLKKLIRLLQVKIVIKEYNQSIQ